MDDEPSRAIFSNDALDSSTNDEASEIMDNIVDDDWGGEDPHGEGISA